MGGALAQLTGDRNSKSPPTTADTARSTTTPSAVSSSPDTRPQTPGVAAGAARGAIVSRDAKPPTPGGKSSSGGGGGADGDADEEMGETVLHICVPPGSWPIFVCG